MLTVWPVGATVSTIKAALGPAPASVLPAESDDLAAVMDILTVPFPVQLERVTVGVDIVPFATLITPQFAPPVVVRVTSVLVRFIVSAPV